MAKFGKKYRQQQIKEWEKEYINYKSLKQFIKDKRKLGSLFDKRDEIINNFKEQLDKELKKFYIFFINQERELYLGINKRLHYRNNYSSYNLEEIINEYNELFKIQNLCFNLSFYVNMNIKAIYKILKKFDHKLLSLQSDLSREYIIEKFGMKNSDLLYIFQYKMIDEVSAVNEDLKNELEYYYNLFIEGNNNLKNKKDTKNDSLINTKIIDDNSIKKYNFNEKKTNFQIILDKTEIKYQDILLQYRIWNRYFELYEYKQESTLLNKTLNLNKGTFHSIINKINIMMSESNERNILISLIQTCFMNICYSYIFPLMLTLTSQIYSNNKTNIYFLILGMTPLGGLLSMLYIKFLIYKTYKTPMLISSILSIIGNLLIILFNDNILCLCLSRLIFGFSLNNSVNRKYLIEFIPKKKIQIYLIYFKLLSILGLSFGFFLTFFSSLLTKDLKKIFLIPTFILLFLSILIFIFIFFFYSEPVDKKFNVYAEGLDPTKAVSRGEIISIDEYLTNFESEKLNELNNKLSLFNDENNFNDTNLLSISIEDIINREMGKNNILFKGFLLILLYVFILRYQIFSFISVTPIFTNFVYNNNKFLVIKFTSLLFFFVYFFFIGIFVFNLFYISVKIEKIKYILILSLILTLLEIIIIFLCEKFLFPFYAFFLVIIINIILVCEDEMFYLFAKIIPYKFKFLNITGINFIHIMVYLGEMFGCFFGLISFLITAKREKLMVQYNIIFILLIICFLEFFFLKYSNDFKDKPIRRIMFKKNERKIQRMEF